ncbi:MAG: hypothetical protein HKM04_05570 [Legionellales bacterium]|nr:hypothetical protein [Legionellales bacterium]
MDNLLPSSHSTSSAMQYPAVVVCFARTLKTMMSIQPVIHHLIAIGFALLVMVLLSQKNLFPPVVTQYFIYSDDLIYGLILYQVMRAASRSLFISCVTVLLSTIGFFMHTQGYCLGVSTPDLQYVMLLGVAGLVISIFAIK